MLFAKSHFGVAEQAKSEKASQITGYSPPTVYLVLLLWQRRNMSPMSSLNTFNKLLKLFLSLFSYLSNEDKGIQQAHI